MNRRTFLKLGGTGAAGLTLPASLFAGNTKKPNIILILVDDLGWKDVSFMGSRYYDTPNVDKLARQGITFTDAYANAPNCAPSRACLLTGQYTPRHGIYTVGSSERGKARYRKLIPIKNKTILDREKITIAEALKPAGYVSASMGKWHLGDDPLFGPIGQGFDLNIGGNHAGHPKSYFSPYRNKDLPDGPPGEQLTDRLTREALKFIAENKNRPFFLYLPYFAVHSPLQGKKELIEKYRTKGGRDGQSNATYAAMVETVDRNVGKIMAKLNRLDLSDNTVVIFFSDNGGVRRVTSMAPLRGGKGMLYEGGIRVPMIIRWPGHTTPNSVSHTPVMGMDLFATVLEIAGAKKPQQQIIDGISILPTFSGKRLNREAIFWHFPAYLQGKAKGARDPLFRTRPGSAVRMGNWKLIEYFEDSELELYNLKQDIGESHNLAKQMPQKTKELHRLLIRWRKSVHAPVPKELNPKYKPVEMD